ncbi:MAG: O-antigen ligase family protein [Chloroflexi bacterium]|nr:O-antigen ligase family protein [Chloroflexota bacterium]
MGITKRFALLTRNILSVVSGRLSARILESFVFGVVAILAFIDINNYSNILPLNYTAKTIISCICLLLICLYVAKPPSFQNYYRIVPKGLWAAFVVVLAVSSVVGTKYSLIMLLLVCAFYVYYILDFSRDRTKELYLLLSRSLVICGAVVVITNLYLYPIGKQYSGIFVNSNALAVFLNSVFIGFLVTADSVSARLKQSRQTLALFLSLCLIGGLFVTIQVYTNSRAGLIVMGVSVIAYLLVALNEKSFLNAIKVLALTAIFFVMMFIWLPPILEGTFEPTLKTDLSDQVTETQKASETDDKTIQASSKVYEDAINLHKERIASGLDSVDSFFTNRLRIYSTYYDHLNLFGHSPDQQMALKAEHKLPGTTSHNAYLEIAYDAGIPAGIVFLVIIVYSFVLFLIKIARKKPDSKPVLFEILMFSSYCLYSLVESNYHPITLSVFFLFLVLKYPFGKDWNDIINRKEDMKLPLVERQ